ncbi:tRNA dihydrouridine(20/20a) synthase DusA [Granulosicoccus antarcticus]|uniref:tRNA-dihydrouridine(20/20a) synthase n=1 Tax=Granulosicoccus antarcticus IMCC3135 TaxID=1192854 RepID=A0A2Z2NW65_9GAMM|nr:tRNA dihydrouridine(20/20a) synthase DusA [Granulosicoccus antarcticus]ASJ74755.1 tRNA-dihydrouridine(20/20a) synthase [Granulosicoccus antarcticus IMCC3135]
MPEPFDKAHRKLVVAPMMELTDRHYRYLARLLTRHTLLYTEMLTCKAVIHGDRSYLLGKHAAEGPVVLQLGGSDVAEMAQAAAIGAEWGYDEINMNVGCPSDRVKAGRFGACLMAEPQLVRDVVAGMAAAVDVPVTVKCRLGIDRDDSYEALESFVDQVAASGCEYFTVHARKAWLDGLSPKENRTIPPLRYEYVYRLKQAFPQLHISINGGIDSLDASLEHLQQVDGVMVGRAAYYSPAMLAESDQRIFPELAGGYEHLADLETLSAVALAYARYMQEWLDQGVRMSSLSRHLIPLFQEVPGSRLWRRHLSEHASKTTDAVALVEQALEYVTSDARRTA